MKSLNLVFIINSPYPNYSGGIENWLFNLTSLLARDHNIVIISIDSDEYRALYEIKDGIRNIRIKTLSSFKFLRPFLRSYLSLLDMILASRMMYSAVIRNFSKGKIYHVICLDTIFCVKAGRAFKKLNPNNILISSSRCPLAEMYSERYWGLSKYFYAIERNALNSVDKIWANGSDTCSLLLKKGFVSTIIINGVDLKSVESTSPNEEYSKLFKNNFTIVNVSTLSPIKGINELIKALSILRYEFSQKAIVFFVGKGDSEPYRTLAKSLNVDDFILFLGHQSTPASFLKAANLSTCLSGGSGLSMSAIEAMAAGIPIIAWDSDVYRQFNVEQKNMKLVKERDPYELAVALNDSMLNYDSYLHRAALAKQYVKQYDWSVVKALFLQHLRSQ